MNYVTCPFCGSNLDYGEKCDCAERETDEQEEKADGAESTSGETARSDYLAGGVG